MKALSRRALVLLWPVLLLLPGAAPASGTPWRPWPTDGKEHELTANRSNDASPAWSPDGRWVAYTVEDERGVNPMLLNVTTGESAPLTSGEDLNLKPVWSPDGTRQAWLNRTEVYMNGMVSETGPGGRHGEFQKRAAEAHQEWRLEKREKHVLDQFAEARRIFEQRAREAKL